MCHGACINRGPHGGAPSATAACTGRMLRGGSFDLPAASIRVTSRTSSDAEVGEIFIGFRVARALEDRLAAAAE